MEELSIREFPWGTITAVETDDICGYLVAKYAVWPEGARIYFDGFDVTPHDEAGVQHLQTLSGEFTVTVAPKGPQALPLLLMTAVSIGIGYLLRPDIDVGAEQGSWDPGSPTNSPGRISNRERIGKRVPDLYGPVRHTPDLLAPTIVRYEDGQRVEYSYMCVGRGYMADDRFDIFDGDVPVNTIQGYSAAVWRPGANIFSNPQHEVGESIDVDALGTMCWKLLDASYYTAIPPHNNHTMTAVGVGSTGTSYLYPIASSANNSWPNGHIRSVLGADQPATWPPSPYFGTGYSVDYNLSVQYPPGSRIRIENVVSTSGAVVAPTGIEGTYTVLSSSGEFATLDIPEDKRAAWEAYTNPYSGVGISYVRMDIVQLSATVTKPVPLAVDRIDVTLEAPNGMFFNNSNTVANREFSVITVWTPLVGGSSSYSTDTIRVSGSSRQRTGATARMLAPSVYAGIECSVDVLVYSTTPFNDDLDGWTEGSEGRVDLLSVAAGLEATEPTNPEITTMLVRVPMNTATAELRTRGVTVETYKQLIVDNGPFPISPVGDDNYLWHNIIADMALDARVGRMSSTNLGDWSAVSDAITTYMAGNDDLLRFGWVFDGDNDTFADMLTTVASAMGLIAYRVGPEIQFRHMRPESIPVLLFNCRNKLPNSETRTVRFGSQDNIDQAIVNYVDYETETYEKTSVRYPDTGSEYTPAQMNFVGLLFSAQASYLAGRAYNKAIYEYIMTEFTATEEAALLIPGDLIVVADSTKADVIEGDLQSVSGTTITLTAAVQLRESAIDTTNFVAFFQMPDGTVITRDIVTPPHWESLTLTIDSALPASSTDDANFARTTFYIVEDTTAAQSRDLFIVDTVTPEEAGTYKVQAHNYDERVYQDDPTS